MSLKLGFGGIEIGVHRVVRNDGRQYGLFAIADNITDIDQLAADSA